MKDKKSVKCKKQVLIGSNDKLTAKSAISPIEIDRNNWISKLETLSPKLQFADQLAQAVKSMQLSHVTKSVQLTEQLAYAAKSMQFMDQFRHLRSPTFEIAEAARANLQSIQSLSEMNPLLNGHLKTNLRTIDMATALKNSTLSTERINADWQIGITTSRLAETHLAMQKSYESIKGFQQLIDRSQLNSFNNLTETIETLKSRLGLFDIGRYSELFCVYPKNILNLQAGEILPTLSSKLLKEKASLHNLLYKLSDLIVDSPSTSLLRFLVGLSERLELLDRMINIIERITVSPNLPSEIDQAVALLRFDILDAEEFLEVLFSIDDSEIQVVSRQYVQAWLDARILADRLTFLEKRSKKLLSQIATL